VLKACVERAACAIAIESVIRNRRPASLFTTLLVARRACGVVEITHRASPYGSEAAGRDVDRAGARSRKRLELGAAIRSSCCVVMSRTPRIAGRGVVNNGNPASRETFIVVDRSARVHDGSSRDARTVVAISARRDAPRPLATAQSATLRAGRRHSPRAPTLHFARPAHVRDSSTSQPVLRLPADTPAHG